jgi:hypothetical protein
MKVGKRERRKEGKRYREIEKSETKAIQSGGKEKERELRRKIEKEGKQKN